MVQRPRSTIILQRALVFNIFTICHTNFFQHTIANGLSSMHLARSHTLSSLQRSCIAQNTCLAMSPNSWHRSLCYCCSSCLRLLQDHSSSGGQSSCILMERKKKQSCSLSLPLGGCLVFSQ